MSPRPPADGNARPFEVAIVGNDAVLAALPSRPMQLAHALLACGFDFVVPVSWGEEAIAEQALRALGERGSAPVVFCACPLERARLLSAGSELAPHLLTLAAPSVATARYLRALHPGVSLHITVIGECPATRDPAIDGTIAPVALLRLLAERGISLVGQPAVFDSVLPPDRRRFLSLPGGCPAPGALAMRAPERRLVTITDHLFATELADYLLGHESVLIDLSPLLACACCGGLGGREHGGPMGREEILRHEPPRAAAPVIDHDVALELTPHHQAGRDARSGERGVGDDEDPPRLPDIQPIDSMRRSADRPRIAVTPPRAVPDRVAHRHPLAPTIDPPVPRPVAFSRPVEATETAPVGRDSGATAEVPTTRSGWGARTATDRPVSMERSTEGVADHASHVSSAGLAPSGDVASVAVEREVTIPTYFPANSPTYSPTLHVRRRTTPERFHPSRSQRIPRARSAEGKVLPRAYIRHAAPQPRFAAPTASDADAPRHVETERRLDIAVEPPASRMAAVVVPPAPTDELPTARAAGPAAPSSEAGSGSLSEAPHPYPRRPDDEAPWVNPESLVEPSPFVGDRREPASMDVTRSSPVAALAPAPVLSPVPPPIAAPVRASTPMAGTPPSQERQGSRGVRRYPDRPNREETPRELGPMAVFITTVILVFALLILLAIIFRWAPTAP